MASKEVPGKPTRVGLDQIFALIPIAFFVLFFYLLYQLFSPFLGSIAWALVLAILFTPLHRKLLVRFKSRRGLTAMLMTVIVTISIVIPAGFMSIVIARQAALGFTYLADTIGELESKDESGQGDDSLLSRIPEKILAKVDLNNVNVRERFMDFLRTLSSRAVQWSTAIVQNLVQMFFGLFVMLFTLYYVFKDGEAAMRYVQNIHPMIRQTRIFRKFNELTFTTFYAGFVVAAVQGLLAGIAFAVLGVPSAFFWGTMTALMSFVPLIGATAIWLPIVIWFLIQGAWGKAIGMALWGVGVVSVADNIIKPALIGGRMNLHPLLVFFSVLGGLKFFGFLGVVLGPLVLVLCLSLLDAMVASRPVTAGD